MSEPPKAFKSVNRVARKDHRCCECGKAILRGEKYVYHSGIWDRPADFKHCLNCAEIMRLAVIYDDYDGVDFCGLYEWFVGYSCQGFSGQSWLNGMAECIGIDPEKLNLLLCVKTESE